MLKNIYVDKQNMFQGDGKPLPFVFSESKADENQSDLFSYILNLFVMLKKCFMKWSKNVWTACV